MCQAIVSSVESAMDSMVSDTSSCLCMMHVLFIMFE